MVFQATPCVPDAFCSSDVEDAVSIVDQADFPQHGEHTFSALSEQSFDEGLHSAEPHTDLSWSQVHSDELHSVVSGAERPALPYLQVSQPTTSSFSPLRRGPLFAESVEVMQSLDHVSGAGASATTQGETPSFEALHFTTEELAFAFVEGELVREAQAPASCSSCFELCRIRTPQG